MKIHALSFALLVSCTAAMAADPAVPAVDHRFIVERSFPKGALEGLDATRKQQINATNARFGVKWEMSYANEDKTATYCVYDAPNEKAIRDAAAANGIAVDKVTEVPVTLNPEGGDRHTGR